MGWDGMEWNGMGWAAQIGFHLFEYSRHFLTCCKRILGLNEGDSNNRGVSSCVSVQQLLLLLLLLWLLLSQLRHEVYM